MLRYLFTENGFIIVWLHLLEKSGLLFLNKVNVIRLRLQYWFLINKKCWREADRLSLFLKNLHCLGPDLSTLSLKSVKLFGWSLSLILNCEQFPFVLGHSTCGAMRNSSFAQYGTCFLHSILFHFYFSFASRIFYFQLCRMCPIEFSRSVLIHFVVLFDSAAFKGIFNYFKLGVESELELVTASAIIAANNIMKKMEVMVSRTKYALEESQLLESGNAVLCKLGTDPVSQSLRASRAAHTRAMKDGRIQELPFQVLCKRNFAFTQLNICGSCIWYLTIVRQKRRSRMKAACPKRSRHIFNFM